MSQSRRFNSQDYLDAYRRAGTFPRIHASLFSWVVQRTMSENLCDLCCSTGLLGQHLLRTVAQRVVGVERDTKAIAAARQAGIAFPILAVTVTNETLPELQDFLLRHRMQAVVARRALPELVGDTGVDPEALARALATAGINEIFLQGRVKTATATNPLATIHDEAAALGSHYATIAIKGDLAHLRRKS